MFVVLGSAGAGTAASKFIAEYRATGNKEGIARIFKLSYIFAIVLAVVITLGVLIFSRPMARSTFGNPDLAIDMQLGAILLFFSIIYTTQNGVLGGFENFKAIAINTLIASAFEACGIITGSYFYGVSGAILGYGLSLLVWCLINEYSINKCFREADVERHGVQIRRSDFSIIWKFAIPASLNSLMVAPSFWLIKTMLTRYDGSAALGVYEAADQWKVIILFAPNAIANILMPIFSNILGAKHENSYKRLLRVSVFLNGGISLVLGLGIWIFKDIIMRMYGAGFENPEVLMVLCFSTVFTSMAQVLTLSLVSEGKVWISFFFNALWAVLLIGLSYFFLEEGLGTLSLCLANIIAYTIHFILQFIYCIVWKK